SRTTCCSTRTSSLHSMLARSLPSTAAKASEPSNWSKPFTLLRGRTNPSNRATTYLEGRHPLPWSVHQRAWCHGAHRRRGGRVRELGTAHPRFGWHGCGRRDGAFRVGGVRG